jgi:hypothetical protein
MCQVEMFHCAKTAGNPNRKHVMMLSFAICRKSVRNQIDTLIKFNDGKEFGLRNTIEVVGSDIKDTSIQCDNTSAWPQFRKKVPTLPGPEIHLGGD